MSLNAKNFLAAAAVLALSPLAIGASSSGTVGWEEQVIIAPEQLSVKAEMDTSSENSSLLAANVVPFDKNGEKWVHFTVQVPKGITGTMTDVQFERKILRSEKSKGLIGGSGHRQIVKIGLCIGNQLYQEELTLKSRSKKDYVVTLGRSTLQHIGVVDSGRVNLNKPECSDASLKSSG